MDIPSSPTHQDGQDVSRSVRISKGETVCHSNTSGVKTSANSTPVACGIKRRPNYMDQVGDMAQQDRVQRLKLTEIKEKEKTVRSKTKVNIRREIEMARMRHQDDQAEKQRQHELRMIERQLELERIRAGNQNHGLPPHLGPSHPIPFGYPPQAYPGIDPNL